MEQGQATLRCTHLKSEAVRTSRELAPICFRHYQSWCRRLGRRCELPQKQSPLGAADLCCYRRRIFRGAQAL
jgi:hypothetical protein